MKFDTHSFVGSEQDNIYLTIPDAIGFNLTYKDSAYILWQKKTKSGWMNVEEGESFFINYTPDMDNTLFRVIACGTGKEDALTIGNNLVSQSDDYDDCSVGIDSFFVSYCPSMHVYLDTKDYVGCLADGEKVITVEDEYSDSIVTVHWEKRQPGVDMNNWTPIHIGKSSNEHCT